MAVNWVYIAQECRKLHVLVLIIIITTSNSTLLIFSFPFVFEKQTQRSRGSIITVKNQKGEDGGGFLPPTSMLPDLGSAFVPSSL